MSKTTGRTRLIAPVLALIVAFACTLAFAPAAFAADGKLMQGEIQKQGELRAQADDGNGVGKDIERALITMPTTSFTYTGAEINPEFTVVLDGKTLRGSTDFQDMSADYWYFFENHVDVNTPETPEADRPHLVIATFDDAEPYVYVREVYFNITPANIAQATAKATNEGYTGKAPQPATVVTYNGMTLQRDKDYTVTKNKRKKIGKSSVTVIGQGNYNGKKKVPFKITKANINNAKFSNVKDRVFTGNKITPNVKVKYYGKTLKKNRDYTIKYKNNRNVGVATITIKGKGNLKGTHKIAFAITPRPLSQVKQYDISSQMWAGGPLTPTPTLRFNGGTLQEGRDFWVDYRNNTEVGMYATARVYGIGNYSGKLSLPFRIVPRPINDSSVDAGYDRASYPLGSYPDPVVFFNGRKLIEGVDYAVGSKYENATTKRGESTIYAIGLHFSGSVRVTYNII